jgi:hypothetical protein
VAGASILRTRMLALLALARSVWGIDEMEQGADRIHECRMTSRRTSRMWTASGRSRVQFHSTAITPYVLFIVYVSLELC